MKDLFRQKYPLNSFPPPKFSKLQIQSEAQNSTIQKTVNETKHKFNHKYICQNQEKDINHMTFKQATKLNTKL